MLDLTGDDNELLERLSRDGTEVNYAINLLEQPLVLPTGGGYAQQGYAQQGEEGGRGQGDDYSRGGSNRDGNRDSNR